jgi:hypothetical protein
MTIRGAAREAKIIRDPTPYDLLLRAWRRATDADRSRFMDFIDQWLREREDAS